jgi:hypothetical protein
MAASAALHGPVPTPRPQRPSAASHTPLAHTTCAAAGEHDPSSTGACPGTTGSAAPFGSLAAQACAPVSQKAKEASQSASERHAPGALQSEVALHEPERHVVSVSPSHGPCPSA